RPQATLADFSAELTERAELGQAPAVDGVTLASMHAAKGLARDAVLPPGLAEGLMPIVPARTPDAIEEETRLLAVAATPARGPPRALAARLLHPPGRSGGAARVPGGPGAGRAVLHHPAGVGRPARRGDLHPVRVLPPRGAGPGARRPDAGRAAARRDRAELGP